MHGEPAAAQIRVVDDVVVDERRGVDELDDRGVAASRGRRRSRASRDGHEQHGRPHALAAAGLDVSADLGNQLDLRLDVSRELAVDLFEVRADRLEDLRKGQATIFPRRFR